MSSSKPAQPIAPQGQPPKFSHIENYKFWIISSFLLVVAVGWPIWWLTTAVYRASLPFDSIRYQAHGHLFNERKLEFKLQYHVQIDKNFALAGEEFAGMLNQFEAAVNNTIPFISNQVSFQCKFQKASAAADISTFAPGNYLISFVKQSESQPESISLGPQRLIKIQTKSIDKTAKNNIIDTISLLIRNEIEQIRESFNDDSKQGLSIVKYSPEYKLTFHMFNGNTEASKYSWDIDKLLNNHISPFLMRLGNFSTFKFDSQITEYAHVKFRPEKVGDEYHIPHEQLPILVNTAEWDLASALVSTIELNFMMYIPPQHYQPLYIIRSEGSKHTLNAITLPRSGGMVILPTVESSHLSMENSLDKIGSIWLQQMRELLGIFSILPDPLLADLKQQAKAVIIEHSEEYAITDLEYDVLLRKRIAENVFSSIESLDALDRMLTKLENMVVGDHIQTLVTNSFKFLQKVQDMLKIPNMLEEAFVASKEAFQTSESAFFDHSMTSLLYFPSEHLLAVYLPFFFPVAVPYLASIIKYVKERRDKID